LFFCGQAQRGSTYGRGSDVRSEEDLGFKGTLRGVIQYATRSLGVRSYIAFGEHSTSVEVGC
jgi:hypothetical protein